MGLGDGVGVPCVLVIVQDGVPLAAMGTNEQLLTWKKPAGTSSLAVQVAPLLLKPVTVVLKSLPGAACPEGGDGVPLVQVTWTVTGAVKDVSV